MLSNLVMMGLMNNRLTTSEYGGKNLLNKLNINITRINTKVTLYK